jgi:hypothetical protein
MRQPRAASPTIALIGGREIADMHVSANTAMLDRHRHTAIPPPPAVSARMGAGAAIIPCPAPLYIVARQNHGRQARMHNACFSPYYWFSVSDATATTGCRLFSVCGGVWAPRAPGQCAWMQRRMAWKGSPQYDSLACSPSPPQSRDGHRTICCCRTPPPPPQARVRRPNRRALCPFGRECRQAAARGAQLLADRSLPPHASGGGQECSACCIQRPSSHD